jgi:hypothetical protein
MICSLLSIGDVNGVCCSSSSSLRGCWAEDFWFSALKRPYQRYTLLIFSSLNGMEDGRCLFNPNRDNGDTFSPLPVILM